MITQLPSKYCSVRLSMLYMYISRNINCRRGYYNLVFHYYAALNKNSMGHSASTPDTNKHPYKSHTRDDKSPGKIET